MLRNARIYVCTAAEPPTGDAMGKAIGQSHWAPLPALRVSGIGFDSIDGAESRWIDVGKWIVARVRHTERKVSSQAVKEAAAERIKAAEAQNGGRIRHADRREILEDVRSTLTLKAPPESVWRWFAYHPERRLIVMDGNRNQCEVTLGLLRGALGSLNVRPAQYSRPAEWAMTSWMQHESAPEGTEFGESCDMRHPEDTANKVRFRAHALDQDDVRAALDNGLMVTALELTQDLGWNEPLRFTLREDCSLKSIRHPAIEAAEAIEDPLMRLKADLAMALGNIRGVVDLMTRQLGGMPELQEAQGVAA